jgi:hypothetical protein
MKLKAVWTPEAAQVVAPLVLTVLKDSSEKASIHFSPDKVFITSLSKRKDQSESWLDLRPAHAFSSIVCESLRSNRIDLAMPAASLALVFKYVATSLFCAMRLTKRGAEPILRFELNFLDAGNCLVVHDVPVEVLRPELAWAQPVLPDPDARVLLPPSAKRLNQFLDKARQMGISDVAAEITTAPNSMAELALVGVCDSVKATIALKNLVTPTQVATGSTARALTTVHLTASGVSFVLAKVLATPQTCSCVFIAGDSKYVSVWIELPNQYGSIVAITPAILAD